jgi:hypothetical protein
MNRSLAKTSDVKNGDADVLVARKRHAQVNGSCQVRTLTCQGDNWSRQRKDLALHPADAEQAQVATIGGDGNLFKKSERLLLIFQNTNLFKKSERLCLLSRL